ncbi:MAG TPA: EF-P lysine aminoacylase GenX [Cycloclasticus sp.]|nr:EF-P lysine aminoacylase GenX [Cycloclasticus sp.]HIL91758.1 EF-P lysine aminoacylase GenX [Cycloclasticus sp.]
MNDLKNKQWPPTCSAALLHQRAELYQTIRSFFAEKSVLEVDTPVLSRAASCDVNLDSFTANLSNAAQSQRLYLQTSPEFAMKRLLASGSGSIYQIAKSFRRSESGRFHNPEFTLLEWYRVDFSMTELIEEMIELLMLCFSENLAFTTVSYGQLFQQLTGIDPHSASLDELISYASEQENPEAVNICGDSRANGLDYVFSQYIQPTLKKNLVYFVTDYPVCMAMLANISETEPKVAKRFEVYFKGVELANGYQELTDVKEQQERFQQELEERKSEGLEPVPMDMNLLAALEFGLPTCSGVAMGLDRLLMLMTDAASIDDVLTFPIARA